MQQPPHDPERFSQLLAEAQKIVADCRPGKMFGSPAVYVGRRMAACVFGNEIALRVPAQVATRALDAGSAIAFQPFGRSPMKEWISLKDPDALIEHLTLLAEALNFASANATPPPRRLPRKQKKTQPDG
ncbi:TfoX/Sxy family protein [Asticcacaulis sp. 201]|uniref:TfoX/Sxy family protein n=1 Tax=Asticcacaulis sp. 201 TaxID=3028787 RepID=UPI0029168754|nr:TfoX/Sxy family protein [Asticcacaulis sp. 201]MDV6330032.1 TfoX/Sxy family protein [Asticcacaulis sp. 201]